MSQYIGRRIVPVHGGVWDNSKNYEELTIVLHEASGDSYISRRPVPAGTVIGDKNYWMLYSLYSQQIADAVAQMEETDTALRKELSDTESRMEKRVAGAENLTNSNKAELNGRMDGIDKRLDANVAASTEKNANYAAEVVDARVGADGKVYGSLGTSIRKVQSGVGIVDQAVTRDKIKNITFSQMDFDGLNVFEFESLEIYKGKQFIGFNTSTFLPIYSEDSAAEEGIIYDFLVSELTSRGITQLFIPTDSPLTQKGVLYTEGEKATNTWFTRQTVEDGKYIIPIGSTVKEYERFAISFKAGNAEINCIRDCSKQAESGIMNWIGTKDIKEGAVTGKKLSADIGIRLYHYPFDKSKKTDWQTTYDREHSDGLIRYVRLYNCNLEYDYGIGAIYRNHVTQHNRYLSIATFDRETHEKLETVAAYSKPNTDDADPDFIECIQLSKNGEAVADIVIDWSLEMKNDWRSTEIFLTEVMSPNGKFDEEVLDAKYILTQSRFNALLQNSFPFNGNIVSTAVGNHRVSRGYDTSTSLPIWVESDYYREYTLDILPYGYYHISRRNNEDTQTLQIYSLSGEGKVLINQQDKENKAEGWNGLSVSDGEITINCLKAYNAGVRQLSVTFDIRQTPNYFIKAEDCYIPSWLGTSQLKHDLFAGSAVEVVLPSMLRVCGGIEMNVYYQNIIRYLNTEKCHLVKPTSTFVNYGQFARWTPDSDGNASFKTKFHFFLTDTYAQDISSEPLSVAAIPNTAGNSMTKRVLFIGDSLTDADAFTEDLLALFESDGMNVQLIGTLGSGENKNEGRSGWRAYTYAKCANGTDDLSNLGYSNPFYNPATSAFDFAYYMECQGYEGVDYVFICLGTNDIARGNHQTDEELTLYWNMMIDSIHEYDKDIRIGLWLPPTRSLMANRNRQAIDSSLAINKWLIANYDSREDERIYLVPVYLNVDPYHDYKSKEVSVSARNSDFTMVVDSDAVHPARAGYRKIADVMYSYIKFFASLDEAE